MFQLDQTDVKILQMLKQNARIQLKDLSAAVHLSGPAVANRIRRLEESGVIEQYTIQVDPKQLGRSLTAFVTVMMKGPDHKGFLHFIRETDDIVEAHRISGHGCYLLRLSVNTNENLNGLLDKILAFGNYQLNISIDAVK